MRPPVDRQHDLSETNGTDMWCKVCHTVALISWDNEDLTIDTRNWPLIGRGTFFEDHLIGRTFDHHWGRTILDSDNALFSTQNLSFNPVHFNRDRAQRLGHRDVVVNPMLVFTVVFGLSVEDLSESGGPFLGARDIRFLREVYPGETVYARSEVVRAEESKSRPDSGIVSWNTRGLATDGEPVIEFERTNLVRKRPAGLESVAAPSGFLKGFHVGDRYRHARSRTVTDVDLNELTLLVMNSAQGHFSDQAMAESEFGERINFGGLTLSLTVGLATQDVAAHCIREIGLDDVKFRTPVKRGDTVRAATEVLAVDGSTVTLQHYGFNQDNQPVCEVKRIIEARTEPEKANYVSQESE